MAIISLEAAELLKSYKRQHLETLTDYIRTNAPSRTDNFYKCTTDMSKVYDAVIEKLRWGNDKQMQFIVEEFYKFGVRQIHTTDVERDVYNILKPLMLKTLADHDMSFAVEQAVTESFSVLLSQLDDGPIWTDMDPVKAAFIAQRAQRNFDFDQEMPEEDYNTILQACVNMPTKQNKSFYRMIVSKDIEFNRLAYDHSIDPTNPDFDRPLHRNGQVWAPLLLIFVPEDPDSIDNPFGDDFYTNYNQSSGIAAGVAAHTAATLGYRTGYCQCVQWSAFFDDAEEQFNIQRPAVNTGLMLGIGKPREDYSRGSIIIEGQYGYEVDDSMDKVINIEFL